MGWRMDSTAGARIWDTQPMSDSELACRDEELRWLMRHERRSWSLINGRISHKGDPTMMAEGTYGALLAYPPAQSLTAVTGGTANVAWWSASVYSPIPANSVLAPQAYRIAATGTITTSSSSQTITPSANCGTAVGTGLGAGVAATLGSTITNALWYLTGDITVRTVGTSGTIIGQFFIKLGQTAGAATGANVLDSIWGNTVQTVDFTSAQGITIGATPSATGISVTPTQVHLMDWN